MAATVERPNVLLTTTDQQRFDAMRLNRPDSPIRTPIMDGLDVPFFIAARNFPLTGGVCRELVCLEDVAATVLDLCGVPQPEIFAGENESRSLATAVQHRADLRYDPGALRPCANRPPRALWGDDAVAPATREC